MCQILYVTCISNDSSYVEGYTGVGSFYHLKHTSRLLRGRMAQMVSSCEGGCSKTCKPTNQLLAPRERWMDGPTMMLMFGKALCLCRPLGLTRYKCIVHEWSFLKSPQLHQQRVVGVNEKNGRFHVVAWKIREVKRYGCKILYDRKVCT